MAEQFLTLMADLDDGSQRIMTKWYEQLQAAGFTGTQTPGLPYHISLASFPLEKETEAIQITKQLAIELAPAEVHISHIGLFSGGKVLFGAPDMNPPELIQYHEAVKAKIGEDFFWTPHVTLLIDEPETICKAIPVLLESFTPLCGKITGLHLCAFWPTREILSVSLTERIASEEKKTIKS